MLSFKKFLLETIMLIENRLEFLKNKFTSFDMAHDPNGEHKEPHAIINHFADSDPHPKKANTQWILNQYRRGNIRQEDSGRVRETLGNFERHKSRLQNKDINSYKHIADLDTAIEPHLGAVSNKEQKRITKHEGADLIYKSPTMMVHKLKTKEAACHYGAGTKWCTAATTGHNYFDHYSKQGPIYVVNHADGKKHQFHFESGQFADEQDRMHQPKELVSKYPELTKVKEFGEGNLHFKSKEEQHKNIENFLSHQDPNVRAGAFNFPLASHDHIHKGLSDPESSVRLAAVYHPNITKEHLDRAINDDNATVRHAVIKNPNATEEHLLKGSQETFPGIAADALRHPNATSELVLKGFSHPNPVVKGAALNAAKYKLTDDHLSKAIKLASEGQKRIMTTWDRLTPAHLDMIADEPDPTLRSEVLYHPNSTEKHYKKLVSDPDAYVRIQAILSRHSTHDDVLKAADSPHADMRDSAFYRATHSDFTPSPEIFNKLAKDGHSHVLDAMVINRHKDAITPEVLGNAIKNPNISSWATSQIVQNHFDKLTDEHVNHLIDHGNSEVSYNIGGITKNPTHLLKIIDKYHKTYPGVAYNALLTQHADTHVLNRGLELGNNYAKIAMDHKNFGDENIWHALKSPDNHPGLLSSRYNIISNSKKLNRKHLEHALNSPDKMTQALAQLRRDNKDNPVNG